MTQPTRSIARDPSHRATRALVDLAAIRRNVRTLRERLGPAAGLMAVVKADAYGHGAVPVARAALETGAAWLAVATVDEGVALRRAGLAAPLLVLAPTAPDEYAEALAPDLALTAGTAGMGASLAEVAHRLGVTARVHVEVDTGLTRFGIPAARAVAEIAALAALPHLEIQGVYTHFAASEAPDKASARAQLALYQQVLDGLEARGLRAPLRHASNSGGVLDLPEAHFDLVRPGIALYGYHPAGWGIDAGDLQPALTWTTRLARVEAVPAGTGVSYNHTFRTERPSVLGLVPVGYADGLPRLLSNRGHMLVRGRRCPIVGRVCMDQTVLDVTDVPGASEGDEAVVIGRQGDGWIGADEVAMHAGTIAYEILCGIAARVPRDYANMSQ